MRDGEDADVDLRDALGREALADQQLELDLAVLLPISDQRAGVAPIEDALGHVLAGIQGDERKRRRLALERPPG